MKLFQKNLLVLIFGTVFFWSCSKSDYQRPVPPPPSGFKGKVITNLVYANSRNWVGQNQDLALDIYFPTTEIPTTRYPLIVFFHGGGYITGDKEISKDECEGLASKGFIVATVNYRLGYRQNSRDSCDESTLPGIYAAFYRGQQDARASLRYLVANADKYAIDTSWIFIEGPSAGAGMALGLAYYTQDTLNHYLPGIADTLGLLDNSGNNLKTTYSFKGIGSMWGGLLFSDAVITSANAIPAIFFHGELDGIDPWDVGHLFTCDNFPLHYGSKALYDRLISFGVPSVAHIDPLAGHGIYDGTFNETNIACFFKGLMTKQPQTGYYTTKVPNCK